MGDGLRDEEMDAVGDEGTRIDEMRGRGGDGDGERVVVCVWGGGRGWEVFC